VGQGRHHDIRRGGGEDGGQGMRDPRDNVLVAILLQVVGLMPLRSGHGVVLISVAAGGTATALSVRLLQRVGYASAGSAKLGMGLRAERRYAEKQDPMRSNHEQGGNGLGRREALRQWVGKAVGIGTATVSQQPGSDKSAAKPPQRRKSRCKVGMANEGES